MSETLNIDQSQELESNRLNLSNVYPFNTLENMTEAEKLSVERAMQVFEIVENPEGFVPKMTEETINDAKEAIESYYNKSPRFKEFKDNLFLDNPSLDEESFMESLRSNKDVMVGVGMCILEDINELASKNLLPERVQANTEKNPRLMTFARPNGLRSREYTAQLALAKLNGKFNKKEHGDGPIEVGTNGKVINGQHRGAANIVLGIPLS